MRPRMKGYPYYIISIFFVGIDHRIVIMYTYSLPDEEFEKSKPLLLLHFTGQLVEDNFQVRPLLTRNDGIRGTSYKRVSQTRPTILHQRYHYSTRGDVK